eukprot:Gb_17905 [translate_table: standard]
MAFQNNKYSVFLSFRGADVRKSLVDHLYRSLSAAGIRTFLDNKELKKESSWCLKELSLMCEHIFTSNSPHKMIPLFYKVEPSHVRYPDGEESPYAKAFHKHSTKARHTKDTIDQWKNAPKAAPDLSGFTLEEASGFEGKLVKQVLMEILKTLNIGSLDVAKYPVGLKERMDKVEDLLRANPNDNSGRTLGIWGMGGIGKTTLCKAVFNDIKSRFNASCFVSDVRERKKESKEELMKLQTQILKGLLKNEFEVNSVDEGKMIMRECLGSKRALLILDDVDNRKQLEALHVDRCFGGGSRVIITTRDKHILNLAQADEIYEAEELERNQALELFSWHAFLRVCPDEGFEDLSNRVVKACKGLPLSLEVMGAHLYDKKDNKAFWDEAVIRIESIMEKDLYDTLKISFNGLHEEERQIFLDITCFFIGDKTTALEIWKAIGCTTICGTWEERLCQKNPVNTLVSAVDCGIVMMLVLANINGLSKSRRISFNMLQMNELQVLNVYRCFSLAELSGHGSLQSLKALELINCDELAELPPLPRGLVQVNIKRCSPLHVTDCFSIVELPGIGSLESLKELELNYCTGLAELPPLPRGLVQTRIKKSQMNVMRDLHVNECFSLAELRGLGSMQSLKEMELINCEELAELPPLPRGLVESDGEGDQHVSNKCSAVDTGVVQFTSIVRICKWNSGMVTIESAKNVETCKDGGLGCEHFNRRPTEDEEISRKITLPFCSDDEHHLGILQEKLPSLIKLASGDFIRCNTRLGTEIVGVYLEVLDQNESGNDDVDIQSNQSRDMEDRPPKRPRLISFGK